MKNFYLFYDHIVTVPLRICTKISCIIHLLWAVLLDPAEGLLSPEPLHQGGMIPGHWGQQPTPLHWSQTLNALHALVSPPMCQWGTCSHLEFQQFCSGHFATAWDLTATLCDCLSKNVSVCDSSGPAAIVKWWLHEYILCHLSVTNYFNLGRDLCLSTAPDSGNTTDYTYFKMWFHMLCLVLRHHWLSVRIYHCGVGSG